MNLILSSPQPSDILAEVFHLGYLQYFFAGDSVLPAYLKYPSKASGSKDVDLMFVIFVRRPYLATIHQD